MWHPMKAGMFLITALFFTLPTLFYLIYFNKTVILSWDFYTTPSNPMNLSLLFDTSGIALMTTVMFIAANVLFFTSLYMEDDLYMPRFVSLVISFIISMCLLVILPNLITVLIGWDGLGLTSYLLVLYYQTPKSQGAAMITAMTNRFGDTLILFTIAWSLNTHWLPLQPWSSPSHALMSTLLILAAMTKSAQFPFISWLPAAMAAPTPVSALVHSSTLVTAGIFLLVRFYPMIQSSKPLELILLFAATITSLVAGIAAMAECDMKKVIALSTLSQLGTMMFSLAMNMPHLAFFHLITHALFKALLFMAAGTLIHFHSHTQDLRSMGKLNSTMPMVSTMMIGSSVALCGAPFTAGFYSKDLILEAQVSNPMNYALITLFIFATGLTTAYSIRLLVNIVWAPRHSTPLNLFQPKMSLTMNLPMLNLAHATIWVAPSLFWLMILPEAEMSLPLSLKLQALMAMSSGLLTGWLLSRGGLINSSWLNVSPKINEAITSLAFTTPINAQASSRIPLSSGSLMQKVMEGGWIETLTSQGTLLSINKMSPLITHSSSKFLSANLLAFLLLSTSLLLLI